MIPEPEAYVLWVIGSCQARVGFFTLFYCCWLKIRQVGGRVSFPVTAALLSLIIA